ncbi:hypothetical protein BDZ94DRAFT_1310755 [Collybia nuda]|uniref:Uncharacterized protein n=1 Tax=Collybia nuda TaxID=64659 RepID=A0A9P5Y2Y8_9AGAR|nr:hypothetical protein BDZ94DRAFT_1310755 [Collybia nuda]
MRMSSISSVETITPRSVSPTTHTHIRENTWPQSKAENSKAGEHGKGKERRTEDKYTGSSSDDGPRTVDAAAYPPINDNEAETRRIEENLRRWEVAERQRRKLARETASNVQGPPSLISDVSRRVSQLWPERKRSRHTPNTSLGTHVALQSRENIDSGPLDYTDTNPIPSPLFTPTPSPRPSSDAHHPHNPFSNPIDESLSPFADSYRQEPSIEDTAGARQITNATRIPPIPKPLGLPPPRTPPPPSDRLQRPTHDRPVRISEDVKPARWWHDWLCGCSEGPDRGGEYQVRSLYSLLLESYEPLHPIVYGKAGRTNPYE